MMRLASHSSTDTRPATENLSQEDSVFSHLRGIYVHRLFEEQVARIPDAVAVVGEGEALTYFQLNARANQVARYLRLRGITNGSLVNFCLHRSVDLFVAMLASLKAGAAFVPLDPESPSHRLRLVLQDTNNSMLLSHSRLRPRLTNYEGEAVWIDELLPQIRHFSEENLAIDIDPRDLAYVIYTSGSTGTPKGVAIEHASLVNLVNWHLRAYQISQSDRATHVSSPAFDATVWEVIPYLCAGASVHVVDDETKRSVSSLKEYLATERITISFLPTPLAELMLEEQYQECRDLRAILTGGDRLRKRPGTTEGARLYNNYGPTENTVVSTATEVSAESDSQSAPSIGIPIRNVEVHVLGDDFNAMPAGEGGELYISGAGLARCYINNPELTAERFIPNPFSEIAGGRMYKSGDAARYLDSGKLEFLGRKDNQVKVRGFRIELGEIETVLMQHASVKVAVADLKYSAAGEGVLIGYIVPNSTPPSEEELKQYLKERLPEYMTPTTFVMRESLPLTVNGKIDRSALPRPGKNGSMINAPFAAPRNAVEEKLAGVWAASLGLEQVGIDDNFFEIGGDSVHSIQAMAMARQAGLRYTARQLFQCQTVAKLAEVVELTDAFSS